MEFGVYNASNGVAALAAADNPQIRLFLAEHRLVIDSRLTGTFRGAASALKAHLRSAVRKQRDRLTALPQTCGAA